MSTRKAMKYFSVLALFAAMNCLAAENIPAIGDGFAVGPKPQLLLTPSAQKNPYATKKFGPVSYQIAINDQGKVVYIATGDVRFKTPEGLHVGSTLKDVLAAGARMPRPQPGWAYHTQLRSGWSAAFAVGEFMTTGKLEPSTKVSWFFKE